MAILINLLQCQREFTGTGRYVRNILHELATLDRDTEFVLIVSDDNHEAYAIDAPNFRQLRVPIDIRRRAVRIAFEQIVLPFQLRRYSAPSAVLWSPNDIPIIGWPGKQIVTMHDLRRLLLPDQFDSVERTYYRTMMRLSVLRASRLLTVSEQSKRDIHRYYGYPLEKIDVTYNAVDPSLTRVTDDRLVTDVLRRLEINQPFVLFTGSQLQVKSPHVLVSGFAQLSAKRPDLRLVLVGKPGNATPLIEREIARLDLSKRVQLLSWVSDADLRVLMSAASVFVFPTRYEGFGIPPLEAMACGTPVIVSRESCMPEVCGDGAHYLSEITPAAISSAIEIVLANASLRASLVEAGLRNVRRFTWNESARTVLRVIDETARAPTQHGNRRSGGVRQ